MKPGVEDFLLVIGTGLVSYGAWLAHPAAGFLICGSLFLAGGVFLAKSKGRN